MFLDHGYTPHDVIRPRVWDNLDVEYWYAQNMLLYMNDAPQPTQWPLRVIHPRMYEQQHAKRRQSAIRRRGARLLRKAARWRRWLAARRAGARGRKGQPTG